MYSKLKNKRVTCVCEDGNRERVFKGTFLNISEEYRQVEILNEKTNTSVFIRIDQILKLEEEIQ